METDLIFLDKHKQEKAFGEQREEREREREQKSKNDIFGTNKTN